MKTFTPHAIAAVVAMASATTALPVYAQGDQVIEEIIVLGTRRDARSASDTPAPVDVISAADLRNQASSDISDLLRTVVPSYQINTQPISDGATIVRPANLRGLSPDHTLVLLNGKRRHRASVISFLGGGISDGAHGPDIGVFPTLGLKQVEVLRDGASSQYGSDAIAGVMNFRLKDASEGGSIEVKSGSTFEGDGDNYHIAWNQGLPLGENGFLNLTAEFGETDATSRSAVRDDVASLITAGNTAVADQSVNTIEGGNKPQIWGQPEIKDDTKLFFNSGFELAEEAELYAFGNYATREVDGGFFFRNPTNRAGVFAGPLVDPVTGVADPNGVKSVLVGDLSTNNTGDCPAGIPLTSGGGLIPDPTVLAQVTGDANCFSFVEMFPGGFVPRFGGTSTDKALVFGVRGQLEGGLGYDISYSYGQNKNEFSIRNTINASLGPNTPTSFKPGTYTQTDSNFNADFNYAISVDAFASDLYIAFGLEMREEEFDIEKGDPASFAIGPLSKSGGAYPTGQGFSSSSNGFGGFTRAITETQESDALYVELEADVTDALTLQAAIRYEDFNTFGSTTNYKLGGLWKVSDTVRVRSTYSTGFHAPTTGQANVTNVTTAFTGGVPQDRGTWPLSSPAGQFVNQQLGGIFSLGPEESTNFSIGAAFDIGEATLTVDYFSIEIDGRISVSEQQDFRGLLGQVGLNAGLSLADLQITSDVNGDGNIDVADGNTSQILNALDNVGVVNKADFQGSEDLTSFGFFNNDFDTETKGVDIVFTLPLDFGSGSSSLAAAFNQTKTEVTRRGSLGDTRLRQLEENLPNSKGNVSFNHAQDNWRLMIRVNFHDDYYEAHLEDASYPIEAGSEFTVDTEFGYAINENVDVVVGAANVFDEYPDENPYVGVAGSKYPATAPFGYNGGQYYLRAIYSY